ncbi:MAG: transposase [Steroidobacteraceae bacterium]|jgi:transposase|nr:transposase [Steroidobacteraceae bacterium]
MDATSEAGAAEMERANLGVSDEAGVRRRRLRSDVEKVKIVEALMKPGASGPEISARYGVHTSLLYRWRRQHEQGLLASKGRSARTARLIPVSIGDSSPKQADPMAVDAVRSPARIEISLSGGRQVQIHGAVDQTTLRAVLQELLRA